MEASNYSPESLMMSYGYDAYQHYGSVKCPLYQTSTFAFKTAEEGKAFFELAYGLRQPIEDEKMGMIYSRINNPNVDILEKRLALYENTEQCAFFSSGMAAISTSILTLLKPGDLLLYASPVYGGTDHFFNHVLSNMGIQALCIDPDSSPQRIINQVASHCPNKKPGAIFIETPGNPTNHLIDLVLIKQLSDYYSVNDHVCYSIVDNTFLGPIFQHPLEFGIDLVLYSGTKFIGGHSDVLCGAVLGKNSLVSQIKGLRTFLGSQIDPHSAWLVQRSLETLKIRMVQQANNAWEIAKFLSSHNKVKNLHYLGFINDERQMKIFSQQCLSPGSMIAFEIEGGEFEAFQFLNNLKLFKLAVSLGSTESLAEHPATMTHCDVSEADRNRIGITPNLIRMSIGLEDSSDLIKAIAIAFETVTKPTKQPNPNNKKHTELS